MAYHQTVKDQKDLEDENLKDSVEPLEEKEGTSFLGHEPDPEEVSEMDTREMAQTMGLYPDADEEHPAELGVDRELERQQEEHLADE
jgi:hypothetical protein